MRPLSVGISVARGTGRRGAGLGNELIPWAKAYVAAEALGHRCPRPLWGMNRYGLAELFGWRRTPRLAAQLLVNSLPRLKITEELYRSAGVTDYGDAMLRLQQQGRLGHANGVLEHSGMWGGYLAVRRARAFILANVLNAPGVAQHAAELDRCADVATVAVHVRRSDFAGDPPTAGQFNRPLPLDWYASAISQVLAGAEQPVRVLLVSDAGRSELAPLLGDRRVEFASKSPIEDLYTLLAADLVIPSVSSFSLAALWLGSATYLWYREQLTDADGWLSIWGAETAQMRQGSPTLDAASHLDQDGGRGFAFDGGAMPIPVLEHLELAAARRRRERDLIYYGAVPSKSHER